MRLLIFDCASSLHFMIGWFDSSVRLAAAGRRGIAKGSAGGLLQFVCPRPPPNLTPLLSLLQSQDDDDALSMQLSPKPLEFPSSDHYQKNIFFFSLFFDSLSILLLFLFSIFLFFFCVFVFFPLSSRARFGNVR
jgi:hypothetical protein